MGNEKRQRLPVCVDFLLKIHIQSLYFVLDYKIRKRHIMVKKIPKIAASDKGLFAICKIRIIWYILRSKLSAYLDLEIGRKI